MRAVRANQKAHQQARFNYQEVTATPGHFKFYVLSVYILPFYR